MNFKEIRWLAALGGALSCEVVLIAGAFAWVAIYSHILHPGEAMDHYQQYAMKASPWVSLILGIPVFYAASRWIGSPTSLALFGLYFLMDTSVLLLAGLGSIPLWFVGINYTLKFLACYFGGKAPAIA